MRQGSAEERHEAVAQRTDDCAPEAPNRFAHNRDRWPQALQPADRRQSARAAPTSEKRPSTGVERSSTAAGQ